MNDKVKSVLDAVLEKFKTGDIPEAITISMFPFPNLPSSNWSMLNRTAMFISGTMDARGFRQWQKGGREDLVTKEKFGLEIIMSYLPEQIGEDELFQIV